MITFENVTKLYKSNVGIENVSLHINKGDFVFLVGASGAGKSTFIKLILKEIDADSGSIIVDGKEVTRLSNREIPELRRKIGIVFQDFRLLAKKTVYENVAFAMEILHCTKRQIRKRVPQILSLVGISDKADKYPNELSAGEQQRVAIARAIINNPTVLIADEPTGNLDPDTAADIMDLLNQINITGTTIVMVTHAKDIVDRMQKRVVVIESGHIVRDEFGQYRESDDLYYDDDYTDDDYNEEMYDSESYSDVNESEEDYVEYRAEGEEKEAADTNYTDEYMDSDESSVTDDTIAIDMTEASEYAEEHSDEDNDSDEEVPENAESEEDNAEEKEVSDNE